MARRIPARLKTIPTLFLVYATVLVAFFLRVYRLADKNIWWDEGWSLWLAKQDLGWIALRTAADEHPPLHYWMLHFWDAVAGWNAFAGHLRMQPATESLDLQQVRHGPSIQKASMDRTMLIILIFRVVSISVRI